MDKITSRENPLIKRAVKLATSSKHRRAEECFFVEGARLCLDAVRSGTPIELLLYTRRGSDRYPEAVETLREAAAKSVEVDEKIMATLADTETPQGIACLCKMLDKIGGAGTIKKNGRYLALENIQDPANLGTTLRTAEALGIDGVLLSRGCCDRYSPKVLRGSMGAVFRLFIKEEEEFPAALRRMGQEGFCTYAAVPAADAVPVTAAQFGPKTVVAVGNEGNGLTETAVAACAARVTIPMLGRAESLNAATAAAILMWEMMRRG
ncbi:MAG TPA: RNA methyltransferase [Candidatus Gallacutalibacter stercoravium]|nr:RNA methyltransferase [Candidatus Gallacutalibacter stercoravium]